MAAYELRLPPLGIYQPTACRREQAQAPEEEKLKTTNGMTHLYTAGLGGGVSVACRKLSASVPTKTATSVSARWLWA